MFSLVFSVQRRAVDAATAPPEFEPLPESLDAGSNFPAQLNFLCMEDLLNGEFDTFRRIRQALDILFLGDP